MYGRKWTQIWQLVRWMPAAASCNGGTFRLGLGFRCTHSGILRTISTKTSKSSKSPGSGGSQDWATQCLCLCGLVVSVYILHHFPSLRCDTCGVTGMSWFEAA